MKTINYNPSPLETEFAGIIEGLKPEINQKLKGSKIVSIQPDKDRDNPTLLIEIADSDGDKHMMVLKIIQRPDEE